MKNLVTRTVEQLENTDIRTEMIVRSIQEETGSPQETGEILSQAVEIWAMLMNSDSYFFALQAKEGK